MDPNTGKFHELASDNTLVDSGEPVPDDWPVFAVGETFSLKGFEFVLARINVSSLVLRPVVGQKPARQVIWELTK